MMKHHPFGILRVPAAIAAAATLLSCSTTSTYDMTDTNDDGRISTAEVETLLIESIFKANDTNGDGKVTAEEWKAANPNDDVALFQARDLNKDGVVTLEEFGKQARETGMFDKFIAQLDPGDDGTVSSADLDAFMKKHKLGQ